MGGTLNVFNLGAKGVNLDKSPVHKEDGELLLAQNGQVDSVGALGGLRCRDGMTKLNAIALAGAPRGIIGLPLPDTSILTRHFYQPIDDSGGAASDDFRTSTDGTTWTTTSAILARPAQHHGIPPTIDKLDCVQWATLGTRMYYPGEDYDRSVAANPTIHAFDGTHDVPIATVPINPRSTVALSSSVFDVLSIIPYNARSLIVTTYDDNTGTGRGRMFLLDVTTGQLTQLGPGQDITDGACPCPIVWQGKIWWLSHNNSAGVQAHARWIRPGDRLWTQDTSTLFASTTRGYAIGAAVFLGDLYIGSAAEVGANAILRKRSRAGTYSTARTGASTIAGNRLGPIIVSRDGATMFVFESQLIIAAGVTTTAGDTMILQTTDGVTFTTAYDVGNQLNNAYQRSGVPTLDRKTGDIYWPVDTYAQYGKSKCLRRTNAGAWSIVDGNVNHLIDGHPARGQFLYLDF